MQELSSTEQAVVWGVLVIALFGIGYAFFLRAQVMALDTGTDRMREVSGFIRDGANAYLNKQFRTIVVLVAVLTLLLASSVALIAPTAEMRARFGDQATLIAAIGRGVAFVIGAFFSYAVGFFGMRVAVQGNVRVASESRKGYDPALQAAYKSGAVTGMLCVGMGLLGATLLVLVFGTATLDVLPSFGLGCSLIALFMRVGGGIYTKAADVGADLVGKVEAGLEEDDPRNAAVIADLVGDNVGDCAGMAADVFESFEIALVSALILGIALGTTVGAAVDMRFAIYPMALYAVGVIAAVIGNLFVRTDDRRRNALGAMRRGFYIAAALAVVGFAGVTLLLMPDKATGVVDWRPFIAALVGIVLTIALDKLAEYFTSTKFAPVKGTSAASQNGAGTNIISGLSLGMESSVYSAILICLSIAASIVIYSGASITSVLYGVSLTGIGMLALTGCTLSMDSFGPISDNANGIGEMSGLDKNARNVMDDLDAVGNTTKAVTKGIAIGSAVIAAVALFGSYLTDVGRVQLELGLPVLTGINVAIPGVFIGLLLGAAVPFLFSAIAIRAVARAASEIVVEVRRQFRIPGVMERTRLPDYAQAVAISTAAAQRELLSLGIVAVASPILVGFLLGVEALGGFLGGVIASGQLMAVFQSNAGGAWDNAKKYIEEGNFGGKHSEPHKAAVVGDTVGDPLKDTSGPALNPMIKVINLVSLIVAPLVVVTSAQGGGTSVTGVIIAAICFAAIAWAVTRSAGEKAA